MASRRSGSTTTAPSPSRGKIEGAARAGCDAVKFQKRTPELAVPRDQWNVMRDTPRGRVSYLDYRHRVEFGFREYEEIDEACIRAGFEWFASCWDEPSVDFMEQFDPPCHKVSSAYPCPLEALNLKMIATLQRNYPQCPVGYSGHETGLAPTWAAVAMGATSVERHATPDRAMWGSDQAASVEMGGLAHLVSNIQDIEQAMGDGLKRIYPCEHPSLRKRRKHIAMGAPPVASEAVRY